MKRKRELKNILSLYLDRDPVQGRTPNLRGRLAIPMDKLDTINAQIEGVSCRLVIDSGSFRSYIMVQMFQRANFVRRNWDLDTLMVISSEKVVEIEVKILKNVEIDLGLGCRFYSTLTMLPSGYGGNNLMFLDAILGATDLRRLSVIQTFTPIPRPTLHFPNTFRCARRGRKSHIADIQYTLSARLTPAKVGRTVEILIDITGCWNMHMSQSFVRDRLGGMMPSKARIYMGRDNQGISWVKCTIEALYCQHGIFLGSLVLASHNGAIDYGRSKMYFNVDKHSYEVDMNVNRV